MLLVRAQQYNMLFFFLYHCESHQMNQSQSLHPFYMHYPLYNLQSRNSLLRSLSFLFLFIRALFFFLFFFFFSIIVIIIIMEYYYCSEKKRKRWKKKENKLREGGVKGGGSVKQEIKRRIYKNKRERDEKEWKRGEKKKGWERRASK